MSWLSDFGRGAARTDRFAGKPEHASLLAAGLMGEAGSVIAEMKKQERELEAYPAFRRRMVEEIGDFLWYFTRLATITATNILAECEGTLCGPRRSGLAPLALYLEFGSAVGNVLHIANAKSSGTEMNTALRRVWGLLQAISVESKIPLDEAASENLEKIESRWPSRRSYAPLFDEQSPEEERLPRTLDIEFRERARGGQKFVLLRCNNLNFGDRITDNILDPDGYRYHDIFHLANAAHLGWSPVTRTLLRCKRKSNSKIDEAEDGARAGIIEEAIAAIVYSRAKQFNYFEGLEHLDYDVLKIVQEFVQGYEVERIPLWQWEAAILDGYQVFRLLRSNKGGHVALSLTKHQLIYTAPH